MSLRFATDPEDASGSFRPEDPAAFRRAVRLTDRLAAELYRRETPPGACASRCADILAADPLRLDALSLYLDARLAEPGGSPAALAGDVARRMEPVLELVGGFGGSLDPDDELSVMFLGCHHALLTATVAAGSYPEALVMCRRHSAWDAASPGDAGAFAGNLLLVLGRLDEAEEFFGTPPVPMPYESAYGEALLRYLQGRHSEAASVLRRAFITQPYVAEIVLRRARGPVPAWRLPDGRALFYSAMSYADAYLGARIWHEGDGRAALFLSWAYNSPEMMAERARALAILSRPGPEATPLELEGAREEFYRFAMSPDPRLAMAITAPVNVGGSRFPPWLVPEPREAEGRRAASGGGSATRTGPGPAEGRETARDRAAGPGNARDRTGDTASDRGSSRASSSATASGATFASGAAFASGIPFAGASSSSGATSGARSGFAGASGTRFGSAGTSGASRAQSGSSRASGFQSGAARPSGASAASATSGPSASKTPAPGQDRRLRPVSSELAEAEDMPADSDWIFASTESAGTGSPCCDTESDSPDAGASALDATGSGPAPRGDPAGNGASEGQGGNNRTATGGNGRTDREDARMSQGDASGGTPPGNCGRKAPEAARTSRSRASADDWAPWSPPGPPDGGGPGGEDPDSDEEPDCGNCEDCEDFEECSRTPEYPEEECDECSECEIEGFCRPMPPPLKEPPYRH
jgi:hypothetical protein